MSLTREELEEDYDVDLAITERDGLKVGEKYFATADVEYDVYAIYEDDEFVVLGFCPPRSGAFGETPWTAVIEVDGMDPQSLPSARLGSGSQKAAA